ncbi:hypothetical protein BI084_gp13 [Gordonia phage Terapin]|uniref:Uncharacterized protein n=5 Tax=Terapinvirus terapin TaxID=2734283 RepID=A0A345MB53_9CAUD|nr:hypothetical protein BI084_gp13 [Gordonia phage Terapin]AVP43290.1 hypothetical protein PBI_DJOKOVIC_13 [Gordonia phage Djokovic]AXH67724.1 hypothetical protein SEA_BEYONCAGE_13 [Gordonia phage Beyoncage]QOC56158.1 head-to-tail adaptor [Gordonia phage Sienna]QOC56583.1 head-to-tail adaptor [Gordonia phage BiteSize]QYW00816.1 hypothetical protein SEA_MADI_13 [Gordonia phage Madi]
MAEAGAIEDVKDLLPAENDWTDDKIGAKLDAGRTVFGVVQNYWESQAARFHAAMDVNESGSVRSFSRLYDNALKQAEYWSSRVAKEEEDNEDPPIDHATIHLATRL